MSHASHARRPDTVTVPAGVAPPYGTPSPRLEATLRVARPFALSSSDLFARFAVSLVSLVSRLRVPGPARGDKAANT